MKLRRIGIWKALPTHVDLLVSQGVISPATHSISFVPYQEGRDFIQECKLREIRLKGRRKKSKEGLEELFSVANEVLV